MEVSVVLLTGGSSGIGAATAHLLASAGMKVYCGSRRGTIDHPQEGIVPVKLDVNDAEGLQACVQDIVQQEGRLDAVVCNAGNGIYGPVEGTLEAEARSQLRPRTLARSKPSRPVCRCSASSILAALSP